jgi:RNA polymerase sigma-70 factor (ECF subfamily)
VEIAGTADTIAEVATAGRIPDRREVLRGVFEHTADGLYRYILFRVGGDRHVADDLLQQTCCEAARHRQPPVRHDDCEAWLRGIARNLVRQHWRRRAGTPRRLPLDDAGRAATLVDDMESRPLPIDSLIRQEAADQLLLAITALNAADQDLIFGFYFNGRSQAAIARELGVTEKCIESRLYRARGRLRDALRNLERSGER